MRSFNEDPRYTVLPIRFINNSSLSNPRKQRELQRLQEDQLIIKFEVEVTFNSFRPHPIPLSTRVAHKQFINNLYKFINNLFYKQIYEQ